MPLSDPHPARTPLHTREIKMDAFHREDGLWDIEGRVVDKKAYSYASAARGEVVAGEPVHDMNIRMTLDNHFEVVDIEVKMDAFPFSICNEVEPNFKELIGLKVGAGWMKRVRERVGGKHGCTHVVELFGPMATVAFQAIPTHMRVMKEKQGIDPNKPTDPNKPMRKPHALGGCHSWAYDSPVVKELMPQWYQGD